MLLTFWRLTLVFVELETLHELVERNLNIPTLFTSTFNEQAKEEFRNVGYHFDRVVKYYIAYKMIQTVSPMLF